MLYIVTEKFKTSWHVGTPLPNIKAEDAIVIQADGDELEYILQKCGAVSTGERVQKWSRDNARIIVEKLLEGKTK